MNPPFLSNERPGLVRPDGDGTPLSNQFSQAHTDCESCDDDFNVEGSKQLSSCGETQVSVLTESANSNTVPSFTNLLGIVGNESHDASIISQRLSISELSTTDNEEYTIIPTDDTKTISMVDQYNEPSFNHFNEPGIINHSTNDESSQYISTLMKLKRIALNLEMWLKGQCIDFLRTEYKNKFYDDYFELVDTEELYLISLSDMVELVEASDNLQEYITTVCGVDLSMDKNHLYELIDALKSMNHCYPVMAPFEAIELQTCMDLVRKCCLANVSTDSKDWICDQLGRLYDKHQQIYVF